MSLKKLFKILYSHLKKLYILKFQKNEDKKYEPQPGIN